MPEYLIILFLLLIISIFVELYFRTHLYHTRKERLIITLLFLIIGTIWDSFAILRGHWVFPEGKNVGITIGVMPLEEYLFIIIVPYFVITIYNLIDSKYHK